MDCSIIGMSIRVEGCDSNLMFWETLLDEGSFMKPMSKERWELLQEGTDKKWGNREDISGMYLEDIDSFDSSLFKLSGGVLKFMDPRQRLLLESCWGAIEDAGLKMSNLKGKRVGVFIAHDGFDFAPYYQKVSEEDLSFQDFVIPGNATSFLANKISYLLDFKGPSMTVDSTCSSIYVALHHAKASLEKGECDYAIVGGVSIFLEPWKKGEVTPTAFEAVDNQINSFSNKAQGYRSSEGCGALLLTKEDIEQEQGYSSYGILKGTGYNSGGKTNSFAQPNQKQQTLLFKEVLDSAQLVPSDIEYIEAHGISSLVGDAIEAKAIIDVFKRNVDSCYISTIKPNIGHAHAASGLYSLMKAILAMKHKCIPPIKGLKGNPLNENIPKDTEGITFVTDAVAWDTSKQKNVLLTSYGFSNVNAAILLSEPKNLLVKTSDYQIGDKAIICLSANTKVQVYQQMKRLVNFLKEQKILEEEGVDIKKLDCHQIAHTLLVGREAMTYRWVALVTSIEELIVTLDLSIAQKDAAEKDVPETFWGDPKQNKEALATLKKDPKALDQKLIEALQSLDYKQLVEYWLTGVNIKWENCYKNKQLQKTHLPIYPFAKKSYWLSKSSKIEEQLHPLVHRNSSNFKEQRFTSIYTGKEKFLSEHQVRGEQVLPGVAYLEMVRAAALFSIEEPVMQFENVRWLSPISTKDIAQEIHVSLFEEEQGIGYEIYSSKEDNEEEVIYGQGKLAFDIDTTKPRAFDLQELQNKFPQNKNKQECYKVFKEIGIELGPSFQAIETLYHNEKESLSKLNLPKDDNFVLQPGILDSALQSCIYLSTNGGELGLQLPFRVKEISIHGEPSQIRWSYIKQREDTNSVKSYDAFLLDEKGEVLITFYEFTLMPLDGFQEIGKIKNKDRSVQENELSKIENKELREQVTDYFTSLIASTLQLEKDQIAVNEPFENYGFDSVMVIRLWDVLKEIFKNLSSTILFEYQNLADLIEYFLLEYPDHFSEMHATTKLPSTDFDATKIPSGNVLSRRQNYALRSKQLVKPSKTSREDIAIVGLSGRYPGANTVNDFWEVLKTGKDCITEIPSDRWDVNEMYDKEKGKTGKSYSKWGGFIEDVDKFDPLFFNISPREAELIDPQERLFLQTAWESIEDGGYTRKTLNEIRSSENSTIGGHVGVYVGVMYSEYQLLGVEESAKGNALSTWSSPSSIANRVSYHLNLHGPSMGVDTMCSSSLTAIHLAVEAIHNGHCSMAIAGGVNISIHSNKYKMLSQSMFVSEKGKCESFGEGGEGYVPSEGVGAVLLKPLHQAKQDGDQIYGVIKGTSLNHGGKTNGFTVPNPNAQAEVIKEAIERAGVQPEDFSYVEAHGTGTSLGDPIEISGLSKAFKNNSKTGQYCAIGSVKSNIGHAESAAGISGLTKVLLQFKNQQLVPSLHSSSLNDKIDFKQTPFKVQQELEDWKVIDNQQRLAGISSFGAGGSNAHLVIEEHISVSSPARFSGPYIFVLSARNMDRLEAQVAHLRSHLEKEKLTLSLPSVAYTLQVGREAMEERLSFIANSVEEVISCLSAYMSGDTSKIYTGNIKNRNSNFLLEGEAGKSYIDTAIRNNELKNLSRLWVEGIDINWSFLYGSTTPSKISLPTYPFSRERYWAYDKPSDLIQGENNLSHLHPLVHRNISDLKTQCFSSVFTGKETFFSDHIVNGDKMLPGVAYLELARAGGEQSIHKPIKQFKNVNWLDAIKVGNTSEEVQIKICPKDEDFSYEIHTLKNDELYLKSQGEISTTIQSSPPKYSLEELSTQFVKSKSKEECYEFFKTLGLDYGFDFQGIEKLWYNNSKSLSKVVLPTDSNYVLSPNVLDSALQACYGLILDQENQHLAIPFSVKEINIYKDLPETFWSYVRKKENKSTYENNLINCDVDLLNEEGEVLVSFQDIIALPIDEPQKSTPRKKVETHLYNYNWVVSPEVPVKENNDLQYVLVGGGSTELVDKLKESFDFDVENITGETEEEYFLHVFKKIKDKIEEKKQIRITLLYDNNDEVNYSFISGLLKSANRENPNINGKIIGVDNLSVANIENLISVLSTELNTTDATVRYVAGKREVKEFQIQDTLPTISKTAVIKEGGVYLITGGAGGLGFLFAEYISNLYDTTKVVLVGRKKELSPEKQKRINQIRGAVYYDCNISDSQEFTKLVQTIKENYKKLDGILHSAGVAESNNILKETESTIRKILLPKVKGTKIIDEVTKNENLDFIIYFSSTSALLGDIGLATYASANAYMDSYAAYRNSLQKQGKRKGVSISINWPLWEDGGLQVSDAVKVYLEQQLGMIPIPKKEGLKAFDNILKNEMPQGIVFYGYKDKIAGNFEISAKDKSSNQSVIVDEKHYEQIKEASITYISGILSEEFKLPKGKLDSRTSFSEYGIDSILTIKLTNRLNTVFDDISNTLFFEYQTVEELVDYFIEEYPNRLVDLVALESTTYDPKYNFDKTVLSKSKNETYRFSSESKLKVNPSSNFAQEDIAIIGLSGRYPGASNINEFWDNLASGKDTVTEVPKDRWDINTMYDSEKGKPGVSYSKWGGFIDDVDKFDPLFFSISPREAELMDPQERLFLQTVWEAIEDSGYTRTRLSEMNADNKSLKNNIGVYAGLMYQDYSLLGVQQSLKGAAVPEGVAANIANRISYFFNFKGPSITLDTMCSSSLTAIHLACQELMTGDIQVAIAGGVNLSVHPNKYVMLCQKHFLSTRGKCESFGQEGDGYVPGEGVGAVLLKRLSEAERDGDHIYGTIKGSSINHGGKSNGYTVPDPNAQAEVITKAIKRAGVQPEDFSYIETHGTGTSLGDPIEISGLSKAFKNSSKTGQYCAIGSVKSNIGHAESAAGISGLTKVLLQFKHQQLAPSLHSSSLNDKINFDKTPFKVQQELATWKTVNNEPRLAGLSGFGAGGSNAHIILEEYIKTNKQSYNSDIPAVIVLSAQNTERLKLQVANLKTAINREPDTNIYDIAYTLQIGRESMPERLAFSASNVEELLVKLNDFESGVVSNLYKGNIKKDASNFVIKGNAGNAYVKTAIEYKELDSLMQLWTTGVAIDWELLYTPEYRPAKISLPTYPFTKDRYWVSEQKSSNNSNYKNQLHPLLHENTSNLKEQRFTTVFTGKESFLTDHKVRKEKVFPGVGYLEMAREAGSISLEAPITQLKDITWLKPVSVNGKPKEVHVSLFEKNGLVNYDIFSGHGDSEIIHGQGQLFSEPQLTSSSFSFDLETLRSRLPNKKRGTECYEFFNELGLGYGHSFQGIESLYYSSSESLSKINLIKESGYILQPGLLDSALQTCIALSMEGSANRLNLPFSVKEVNIHGAVDETVWCYARKSTQNKDNKIKSYDIDMLSNSGTVLLSFKEFLILPIAGLQQAEGNELAAKDEVRLQLYENQWNAQPVKTSVNTEIINHTTVLVGGSVDLADKLKALLKQDVISIKETTELGYFSEVLDIVKSHSHSNEKKKITIIYNTNAYQDYGFISGLLKTAEIENTKLVGKTIGVSDISIDAFDELVAIITSEQEDMHSEVRYLEGDRTIRQLSRLSTDVPKEKLKIKEDGVYLITGGSGGLGKIFANHISQTKNTRIILVGRSKTSKLSTKELNEFNAVHYSCDMTDKESVILLIEKITKDYDKIDGIIHSAGVINDGLIASKTHEESYLSIKPKILGAKNLDLATKDLNLDFMVYFSSMAGVLGNIGQCDYASANTWLDNYASYRNQLKLKGERQGRTLSINWPLWQDGGMHIDADSENYMKDTLGLHPLPLTTGIQAFERLLEHPSDQGVVVYGVNRLVEKTFSKILDTTISKNQTKIVKPLHSSKENNKYEVLVQLVKEAFADIVKIETSKLELDREFIDYGADSVVFTKLIQNLNEELDISLSVAVLFEYKTIEEFVQHILNDHQPIFVDFEETTNENLIDDYVVSETKTEVNKPLYANVSVGNDSDVLVQLVKEAFADIVKMEASKLELDRELIDYGADSVVFTKLIQNLNEELDISLSVAVLFEYKTIEEFVQHILQDHQPNIKNSEVATDEILVSDRISRPVLEKNVRTSSRSRKSDSGVQTVDNDDYAIIAGSGKFVGIETDEELWLKAKNGVKLNVPEQDSSNGDFSFAKFSSEKIDAQRHQILEMNGADINELSYQEYLVFDALSEAMEKYAISKKDLSSKSTGVFIAAKQAYIDLNAIEENKDSFVNLLPNKISFYLDLKGPSEVVNTYCTSVYVAIHRAIQCINAGECEQAIVGGVNLVSTEEMSVTSSTEYGSLLSKDGTSNSFGSNAQGFVRSEGVGVIIIRPLAKVKQSSNHILGLIKASSVVHGGKGYSLDAPSASGIKTVIESALTKSKVDVDTIDYIEAHGIANMLADSIELGAIDTVYKKHSKTPDKKWSISSVKPTVGHAELASGMASILKVLKAFEYKTIPGIPGLDSVNTELDPNNSLHITEESTYWKNGTHPRRASLNGYGIGGVNAHLILEEFPNGDTTKDDKKTEKLEIKLDEKSPLEFGNEVVENVDVRDEIFSVAREVFKLEKHELDLALSPIDFDFDSMSVIQFVRKLNAHFDVELKMGQVLNADSFEAIFQLFESAVKSIDTTTEIVKEPRKSFYPLSAGQKGLWFIDVSEPDSTEYNIPVSFSIEEEIEDTIIYEAAAQLIHEHPILRVTIDVNELSGEPYQEVQEVANYIERDVQEIVNDEVLHQTLNTLLHTRIDITKEVIRLHVRKDKVKNKTYILFVIHHIVFDGVSTLQFITRFKELLNQLILGKTIVSKPSDQAYFDFIEWESKYIVDKKGIEDLDYWKNKFKEKIVKLPLPYDAVSNKLVNTQQKGLQQLLFQGDELKVLREKAKSSKVNLSMLMLSAFKVLLYRLSDTEDIIVTTPTAGRLDQKYENGIGYYVNLLISKATVSGTLPFSTFLKTLKTNFLSDIDHLQYPYARLVRELDVEKADVDEVSPVSFIYQNMFEEISEEDQSQPIQTMDALSLGTTNEYTMEVTDIHDSVTVELKYRKNLFSDESIARHIGYYKTILQEVIANPQIEIDDIEILPEDEKQQLLVELNDTDTDYPKDKCIHELFETQAKQSPKHVAVVFEDTKITYSELEKRSRELAIYLQKQGVNPGTLVGVCMERSIDIIVSILGILRAGGAYIPIDPTYPKERISYIIEDGIVNGNGESQVKFVLVQDHVKQSLGDILDVEETTLISVGSDWQKNVFANTKGKLQRSVSSDDVAFLIYTSGSTGKPKGVLQKHKTIVNLVDYEVKETHVDFSRVSQFATYNFDVSVQEIFSALLNGGELYIVPEKTKLSFEEMKKFLIQNKIVTAFLPTAYFKLFINEFKTDAIPPQSLKCMIVAGEQLVLNKDAISILERNNIELHNHYGPTESHVVSAKIVDFKGENLFLPPIGRPISNTKLYITDKRGYLQPKGVPGELCITGDGLAKGYLNDPKRNLEKFIDNPYGDGQLYKSGDLARWLPNGDIEYLGRIDNQVKIRGYRVELGEIEAILKSHVDVKGSVVIAKDQHDSKALIAYYTPHIADKVIHKDDLISHLSKSLPNYMIPSFFISIPTIPLTANGKVNRRELAQREVETIGTKDFVAPETPLEKQLEKIWIEILQVDKISIHDNFFDLGGHSLSVTRLVALARKDLNIEITVKNIFEYGTISSLALFIGTLTKEVLLPEIEAGYNEELIPLSYSQERLWFLDKLKGSLEYHIPMELRLEGQLELDVLEESLRTLVFRHVALHTVFKSQSGIPYQEALLPKLWTLSKSRLASKTDLNDAINNYLEIPFDLSNDYMFRAHLFDLGEASFSLVFVFHHIAFDGWSQGIFLREFEQVYQTLKQNTEIDLPALTVQYTDYAIWQRKHLDEVFLDKELPYWTKQLEDVSPLLLPTDYTRPVLEDTAGDRMFFNFDNELRESLLAFCQKENVTLFMLLLSAFKILLSRYTGQEDVTVGSPMANRTKEEVNNLIGLFINSLTLRSNVNESTRFTKFLQELKETTLDAYDHQLIPFEKVVDHLVVDRDMSTTPLFQVMFVLQNTPGTSADMDLDGLTIATPSYSKGGKAKYDVTFRLEETASGLSLEIEYRTALFKADRINKMKTHYEELLKSILNTPEECIGNLTMLSKAETDQVLVDFNTTEVLYPKDKTLVDLISEQVKRSKNATALVFEGKEMTYQELDKRSNQLARFLRKKGAKAETLVGICIDRSFDMMVGILGILKSGAAYVPIDPEYPNERITYIVEDASLDIIISKEIHAEVLSEYEKLNIILLDTHWSDIAKESTVKLKRYHEPNNLAYVIYTSGSTGKPKGVMNEHAGIVNRLLWTQDHYKLDPNQDAILQKTTFCFDVSVWELFWPLISGVKLVFAKPNGHKDPAYLKNLIQEQQITTMHFVPSMLGVFLSTINTSDCTSLKNVLCSGEALKLDQISLFKSKFPNVRLDNLYGPTEAAIDVSSWEVPSNVEDLKTVLIGKPVANTKLYVLSPNQKVLPVGAVGELYIGGDQVARGYLNREELTQEKFISDPFSPKKEARLYRTGDFAKWEPDGNINFLGRIDNQVKIRGFRIELGEIENALSGFDKINDAAVVVNKKGKEPQLIAYYQSSYEESVIDEMRSFLEELLPSYMVPPRFIKLDSFPLTASGKTNTKKLSEIDVKSIDIGSSKKPSTETEKKVAEIWEGVLEIQNIGVNDRFFELGGSSLSLVGVREQIEAHYGISLELVELIKHSKVSTLAFFIDEVKNGKLSNNISNNNIQKKDKLSARRKRRKSNKK